MFTGIITATGSLAARSATASGARLRIATPPAFLTGAATGDSIAVSGVCLTVVELFGDGFTVDVSEETLRRTTLGMRALGEPVNLEPSLRLGDKLGGHLVMGHVDGVGRIAAIERTGEGARYQCTMPAELAPLIAHKGSLAVDGVSLTPTDVSGGAFDVWLIPETLRRTSLGSAGVGDPVNLEADLLARYVARQLGLEGAPPASRVTMELLRDEGFVS